VRRRSELGLVFAVAYAVSLGLSVWLVVEAWEPADGPRSEQWVFAVALAAVLTVVAVVAALPMLLGVSASGWYVAAAAFAALSAVAATALTFGLLFLPSLLLLVLAGCNVFRALRIGGLGRGSAAVGVAAAFAVVWLVFAVYLPLVLVPAAAAILVVVVTRRRPRGHRPADGPPPDPRSPSGRGAS
jgi:hypothetical protein